MGRARHRGRNEIGTLPVAARTILAEAADARDHEGRLRGLQFIRCQTVRLEPARTARLEQQVSGEYPLAQRHPRRRCLEIRHDAALRGVRKAKPRAVRGLGRRDPSRRLTPGRFDLPDGRPEIREHLAAVFSALVTQFDNAQTCQRTCHPATLRENAPAFSASAPGRTRRSLPFSAAARKALSPSGSLRQACTRPAFP